MRSTRATHRRPLSKTNVTISGGARRTVTSGVTNHWYTWTLLALGSACSTAEASPEPDALDTVVSALNTSGPSASSSVLSDMLSALVLAEALEEPTNNVIYRGLRRTYSLEDMQLHRCASLQGDGSVVGHECPSGIVAVGPRVVAPTHSDVRVRFTIEASHGIELVTDIVSDKSRQLLGKLDNQTLGANELRTISYTVHVFEAAPTVEARIGVSGRAPIDFRISGLEVQVW